MNMRSDGEIIGELLLVENAPFFEPLSFVSIIWVIDNIV